MGLSFPSGSGDVFRQRHMPGSSESIRDFREVSDRWLTKFEELIRLCPLRAMCERVRSRYVRLVHESIPRPTHLVEEVQGFL